MESSQPHIPPAIVAAISDELAVTFGAWLICACVGCMLFGLTAHQTYRYFRLYPKDGPSLKLLVLALLGLDTMHTVTNIHLCYYYLVVNYLNPSALTSGVWSLRALVMLLSHSFFLRRIFLLGERRVLPVIIIGLLMISEFAFATAVTIMTFILVSFEGFASHMWMIWVMLANAVLIDVLITGCLIFYLWRSRTGFRRTDNLLDVLMVYSINTGLSTSLLTLPAMICSIVMPGNLIWSAIYVIASKMYANSLLAVLNSRRSLIDKGLEGFETGSFGLQVMDSRDPRPFDLKAPLRTPPAGRAGTNTNIMTNTMTNPSMNMNVNARAAPHAAANLKVADRVIDIQVTTETFVDIHPPRRMPSPSTSSSASSFRGLARAQGHGHGHGHGAAQTRNASGSGASLLGGADGRSDGSDSV
ncbi:hypothetical protein V8D89_001578 [Ganoderma adspersum]